MKKKILPLILFGVGIFLLVQVVMPPLAFKVWELTALNQDDVLINPTSTTSVLGVSVENVGDFPAFMSSSLRSTPAPYQEFTLSVPSIKLSNIKVKVDSNTFENSLAQLPGSAMPGEKGNLFITGHSSLTIFYRPDNFQAIFANLPNIKKGDLISVDALSQHFDYQVMGLKVVNPDQTEVINPPDLEGRYLTLMTCVPPGFNTKRLIVLAKLK